MKHRQPRLAVDGIVLFGEKVLLIERKNEPRGWALPGGFVNYGETVEEAVRREVKEETGVELVELRQFKVYSDPGRDPRGHCVSVVFVARGAGEPKAGDDARGIQLVDLKDIDKMPLVFDHRQILLDFIKSQRDEVGD